eukprot:403357661
MDFEKINYPSETYVTQFDRLFFSWDAQFMSPWLKMDTSGAFLEDGTPASLAITCKQTLSGAPTLNCGNQFKSVLGNQPFPQGYRSYFEVKINKGSNFKIGIAGRKCEINLAFSDGKEGWAYYSGGFLRHNSGGDGPKYGVAYSDNSIVGVYVDLIEGKLFFSKDGRMMPIAYENKHFLTMELYPAVSCFQPGESFQLIMPMPED